jgi:glycosyltransferase involved in cell wall biosynthesis
MDNSWQKPLVSVCCTTYNHARFIKDALDGFLMQKTNFPIEIIVHDDCSTDGTAEIIREYEQQYTQFIKPIYQRENQYSKGIKIYASYVWPKARGKYIALCEGDDYWVDPHKLQKQVDFLEQHPECSMCAHNTKIIVSTDATHERLFWYTKNKLFLELGDILKAYPFHTSSVMIRNGIITEYPDWYYRLPGGDWSLYILAAEHGKVGIIDEAMSVYRKHPGGIWTSRSLIDKSRSQIQHYKLLNEYFNHHYQDILFKTLIDQFYNSGKLFLEKEIQSDLTVREIIKRAKIMDEQLLFEGNFMLFQKIMLRRKFNSGFFGALGFHFYKKKDIRNASFYLIKACSYDPYWLSNKGFYSVLGEYIFGRNTADFIRKRN